MFQIGVFQEQRHSLRKQDCTICYWAFFCSLQYYVRQLKINITKYFCKRFYSSPLQNFHYSLFCFLSAYHLSYASKQKHLNGASAWAQRGQLKSGECNWYFGTSFPVWCHSHGLRNTDFFIADIRKILKALHIKLSDKSIWHSLLRYGS